MGMDSMGRITFYVTLLCILHLVFCELFDRHERRSDADDYLTALKRRYHINDDEQRDGKMEGGRGGGGGGRGGRGGGREGGDGGEMEEKEKWKKERNAKESRRRKRNIKIFIRNNGETTTLQKVKETGKLGTTRMKYHGRKVNGEWGVLRFAHASNEKAGELERSERKGKVELSIDGRENRVDKTEKKYHITKLNIPLQRRKYQHVSQRKGHGPLGENTRKWSQGRAVLPLRHGNHGIHAQAVLTSPDVNNSIPTINPNVKFRDSEGNIVISHHSLRVALKDTDKEEDKQEKSVVSSVTRRETRTFHQPSLPSSHQGYTNVQMWTSARALWPDVAKSWKYVDARKRDIELRREKRYIRLKSMRASKRTRGPVTLLVHSRRLGRHSNSNNNTTSNIHDYFRHVFIRKNNNTDTGAIDHTTPTIRTTTATTALKTKKMESVLKNNVIKFRTATMANKKEREEEGRIDKKPPNISNIHDFFRHVFIRKNSTSIGPSQYLPTPGTIGAYDVAHGKVKNLHRKHQQQDQPEQHHRQQQEQDKREEKPHQDQQQQNVLPPTKITGKSHNGHKKKKGRTKVQEVHSVPPPSKKIARKQSPPQVLSSPPKHQKHHQQQQQHQQLQQQQQHRRIAHRKMRKPSHRGINSRVLITPTKTSQETNDNALKVKPVSTPKIGMAGKAYNKTQNQGGRNAGAGEVISVGKGEKETDEVDRKGISEEKPEELEEQATAQAYQTSQLLRGDGNVGDSIHPLASDNLVPTYAAPAVSSEVMPGVYSNLNTATNFNLNPTPARIRWLFGNPNFNPTIANMNVPPVKSVSPSLAFLNQMRSAGMRMGTAFRNQNFLAPTPLIHGPRFQNYLKNSRVRAPARLSMQPLIQENVGYAFDESPTVGALNPMNARIIHERHLAELATNRMKTGLNPAEKKNLVQFRDHNGRILATLRDPNTWNSANVTLSKDDDKRRYMNEWKEIQVEGAMKRGVSSSGGGQRAAASSQKSSTMVRTLSPQDIINEFTPRKVPIISRKIAITTSNLSSNVPSRINSKGIRTDEDGDRVISFHAYKAPLIPLKKSDVGNTNAWAVPTTVYNAGPGISVIGKRDYIYHRPTSLPASLQGEAMAKKDATTSIHEIDPPMEDNDLTQKKRNKQQNDISTTDPWKTMEENILDDKDRAYLVELLSNLGDDARTNIDRIGTRRDDIPGGKNNHQILTKVTKFMGDVEKFIKNVEIISSTFGKDKQIPSKLIKFIVHVEKFIDDIENITTSFGKGPVKRKKKNKDFLAKLQKLVSEQTSNGQSLFDLFQSNASIVATGNSNNETRKNVSGGNLYKETIEFLKNEIEEIEQVRNMLKAEDDRIETNNSARTGNNSTGRYPLASSNHSLDTSPSNETKTNKSNINNTSVTMDTFDHRSAFEGFNKSPLLKDSEIVNKTEEKLLESKDRDQSLRVNESSTEQVLMKEDAKDIDISTLIPVEATSANPDEVKREGKFGNLEKVEKQDDGTVFSPIIPEEEEKKNVTFTITPATLADDMSASPTHRVDQIAGITEPLAKTKEELSKANISKNDVDDDDDSELAKTTADEIKKDEKIEETNLFEGNDTKAGGGSEMKKTEEISHRKNPSTLHDDGDSRTDASGTKLKEKEEKEAVQIKNNDELSDNGENLSTNENATMMHENNISLAESESGNDSPMVITPKLFKESIHEAIRQFAERMKLESSAIDGSSDHAVEKGNRIEKSLIQSHGNTTDINNNINSAQNKSIEVKRDNAVDETDENKSNKTSSRLSRLVEFFLSSKQQGSSSKHNATFLTGDHNSSMNTSSGPESQEVKTLENVRKSFFGRRDENDEETVAEPVLSVAAHYAPKISYNGLQLFTDTNKKSLTMRQRAKLSAATPYDHKKEDNVGGEKSKMTKEEKDESPRHSQTNQTSEYLNKINKEMTGTAVELTPLSPHSAPSTSSFAKGVNLNHSSEVSQRAEKVVPDVKPTTSPKKKNESHKRNASTSTSHATESLAKLSVNSSRSSLVTTLAQPFIFPYGKDMEKYDTPCVRRCLDDGTVLGMCVRSCDLTPVRRNVPSNKSNTVSAPVRSIHLSQPEPYSSLTGALMSRNETMENELEVASPLTSSITRHMSNETEVEQAQVPPVRQFVDEEGNILEQHQDHVATLVKLSETDKDTMSPVLTQSATFDSDKYNEKSINNDKQTNGIKAEINDKQLENDNLENNDKLSYDKHIDDDKNDNDLNKKETKSDQSSDVPPDVPADVSESQNSGLTSSSDENVASTDRNLEKDLCKAGFCSNGTGENEQRDHYCQDRPCFSLKDIWKMLHCSHPPCIPNDGQITNKTPAKFSNETDQLEAKEILMDAESPVNFLTKARYNRILAEQKKKAIKDPAKVFMPNVDKINNALSHTDADDLDKYGPLAPEKATVETDGTILDGPNSNIPGFTGTPDAVTNRIPEPVASGVSTSNKIPEIPGVSTDVSNKIVELAGVTEVAQDMGRNPTFAGELKDERVNHEINTAPGLTDSPDLNHETVKKMPMSRVGNADVGNAKLPLPQCSCSKDGNVACRRHCVTKEKQLSTLKVKQKATQSIIKNPIVVMIKPKPGSKGKKVQNSNDQNQTFTSRVCRSWTYFPYFTCLLESPISRPYIKEKNPPFDGPYENCRTLPAFPFFKCYSNGLSEVLPAQRHKISKGSPKGTKSKAFGKGRKQDKHPSVSPNIGNKMSDAVAKAMLENANRVHSKINTASMSKSGNQLHVKNQLNEQMKRNSQRMTNVSKKQPSTGGIPAKLVSQLEANKRILHTAKNTPILPIKKSMTKPNARPNLFNVKYMLTLPQTKFFVPFKGGIAPNTNLIKPFTGLHSSSKGLARDSLPPSVFPKVRAKIRGPVPPTSIPPIMIPPRKPSSLLRTQFKQTNENAFTNTTTRFPSWFNPKTNFNGYIRALLSQHKVKEAELFKKILRLIMSSPKSRKYNEAGGDPWKYIYPALKWVEEYENVWKPKFKGSNGKKSRPFGNGKVDSKKLTEAVSNTKLPINIPNKNSLKKTVASSEKQRGKAGIKKTIVPGTRISGLSLASQLYNTDGFVDATDKKYWFQEDPSLSLDSLADDEEMQSLGFTTGENAYLSKEMYLR